MSQSSTSPGPRSRPLPAGSRRIAWSRRGTSQTRCRRSPPSPTSITASWTGGRVTSTCGLGRFSIPPVSRFDVGFLGCKVSHADMHEIRERLLADGHTEAAGPSGEIAVINTCCVTNEALAKSRKAAARAARTHRRVYLTGCAANLDSDAFHGLPENVTVVAKRAEETAASVAGDVGAIGCVQADARLDPVRAFV